MSESGAMSERLRAHRGSKGTKYFETVRLSTRRASRVDAMATPRTLATPQATPYVPPARPSVIAHSTGAPPPPVVVASAAAPSSSAPRATTASGQRPPAGPPRSTCFPEVPRGASATRVAAPPAELWAVHGMYYRIPPLYDQLRTVCAARHRPSVPPVSPHPAPSPASPPAPPGTAPSSPSRPHAPQVRHERGVLLCRTRLPERLLEGG